MNPTPAGQALLDVFDTIYVINLRKRTDRLRDMETQLARLGLGFDDRTIFRLDAWSFSDPGEYPTAGTRGCFHSHRDAWHRGLERSARQTVLVLEDDLNFAADIEQRLPSTIAALQMQDWSIFYGAVLQWSPTLKPEQGLGMALPDEGILGGHFIGIRGREALANLHAYLTAMDNRPAGSPDGGPMHVDGAYSWFRKAYPQLKTFVAQPNLGVQRSSRTDIHQLSWKDRLPVIRDLTDHGRRLMRGVSSALHNERGPPSRS